jgi:hypothetical protein
MVIVKRSLDAANAIRAGKNRSLSASISMAGLRAERRCSLI